MTRRFASVAALATVLALAGCSSGSSNNSTGNQPTSSPTTTTPTAEATAPADVAAAKAQITANWDKFFAYNTPRSQAATLLENGDQMSGALAYAANEQKQTHIKQATKVTGVTFTSATRAQVNYELLNGTKVLLATATGLAVLVDGTWKVSKTTFCTLVQLGANGKTVPDC